MCAKAGNFMKLTTTSQQKNNRTTTMKTILIEWKSGLRQVIRDTHENLLDLVVMEIDHIEEIEYVEYIDKTKEENNND